jgi:hypothetical protein
MITPLDEKVPHRAEITANITSSFAWVRLSLFLLVFASPILLQSHQYAIHVLGFFSLKHRLEKP